MGTMASQVTSLTIVYSTDSGTDQRKHESSVPMAFVRGIHWYRGPVTPKMFPFDDVIMNIPEVEWDHYTMGQQKKFGIHSLVWAIQTAKKIQK